MYTHIYTCIFISMYVCVYMCVYVRTCMHMYNHTHRPIKCIILYYLSSDYKQKLSLFLI